MYRMYKKKNLKISKINTYLFLLHRVFFGYINDVWSIAFPRKSNRGCTHRLTMKFSQHAGVTCSFRFVLRCEYLGFVCNALIINFFSKNRTRGRDTALVLHPPTDNKCSLYVYKKTPKRFHCTSVGHFLALNLNSSICVSLKRVRLTRIIFVSRDCNCVRGASTRKKSRSRSVEKRRLIKNLLIHKCARLFRSVTVL